MTWDQLLAYVYAFIADLMTSIRTYTLGLLQNVIVAVTTAIGTIRDYLAQVVSAIVTTLANIMTQIREAIVGVIETLWSWLQEIFDRVVQVTATVIDQIATWVENAIAAVRQMVVDALDWISGLVQTIQTAIGEAIEYLVGVAREALERIGTAIGEFFGPIIDRIVEFITSLAQQIQAMIQSTTNGVGAYLTLLTSKLGDVAIQFGEAATAVVQGITDFGDDYIAPIKDGVQRFLNTFIPDQDPVTVERAVRALQGVHTDPVSMAVFRQWWAEAFQDLAGRPVVYQTVVTALLSVLALIPSMYNIGSYLSQEAVQEFAAAYPNQPLSVADSINAWRHGQITEKEATDQMKRSGIPEQRGNQLIASSGSAPAVEQIIALKLRGEISDDLVSKGLKVNGLDPPWSEEILKLGEIIPPVADLITMAVHDVWNPASDRLGNIFADLPPDMVEWAGKQGLSEKWARFYWGAHWSLPSPSQGFEMFHRGLISSEDLDSLLGLLDIAPGWRAKLRGITYMPYTRVDIRRLNKLGILNEDDVLKAHKDIGYDDDHARRLTDFVLRINKGAPVDEETNLSALSRSTIVDFYRDGLLTKDKAAKLLTDLGLTPETAGLWLASADLEHERAERKEAIALIIEQAISGVLTFEQAADRLRAMNLETTEVERALNRLLQAQQKRVKLPSQDDGEKFFVAGFIQKADYEDLLARLGYAPKWIAAYVRLAESKRTKNA